MKFEVVDVPNVTPVNQGGASGPIIEAMVANVGRAISIPLEGREANSFRKTLRSSIVNRKLLEKYHYRTRVSADKSTLVVWFEAKTEAEIAAGAAGVVDEENDPSSAEPSEVNLDIPEGFGVPVKE